MTDKRSTELEIDLILLFYTFSDQYGVVDIEAASKWAQTKFGVLIGKDRVVIGQGHIDILVDYGVIPDVRHILDRIKCEGPRK